MTIDRENSYIDNPIGLGVVEGIISEGPLRCNSPCKTAVNRQDNIQYGENEQNKGVDELVAIHDHSTDLYKLLIRSRSFTLHDLAKILLNDPDAHFAGYVDIQTGNYFKAVVKSDPLHIQVREGENGGSEVVVADFAKKRLVGVLTTSLVGNEFNMMNLDGME